MTTGSIVRERSSYRRGMILGLTLAEIMTLLLFVLLLLLAVLTAHERQRRNQLVAQIAAAEEQLSLREAALAEALKSRGIPKDAFDDMFRRLKLAEARAQLAEHQRADLIEVNADLRTRLEELQQTSERAEQERDDAKEALANILAALGNRADAERADTMQAISEKLSLAARLEKALGDPSQEAVQKFVRAVEAAVALDPEVRESDGLRKALEVHAEARRRIADLESQNRRFREQLEGGGRGVDWPPCWADEQGKAEYIFDIALRANGIQLRKTDLPHRAAELSKLPAQMIATGHVISAGQFLSETQPLFEWSKEHDCRFFVRVYDETGPTEKSVYKQRLRTVEGRFYKYEPRDGAF